MLETYSYCPTLHSRQAEIKALTQLSAATKSRLFPLLVLRPWPRARHLSKTWEKIKEALGKNRFAIDLDEAAWHSGKPYPATAEFDDLFAPTEGFRTYYEAIGKIPEAIPVLRIANGSAPEFDAQMEHIETIDRGLVVRIRHDASGDPRKLIEDVLNRTSDVSIFVDAGWSVDILGREMWASAIIEYVSRKKPGIEIVIAGSSFPQTFTDVNVRGEHPVKERFLYDSLVRRHNSAVLFYGDWGSTRPPPREPKPMHNVPRIDLPTTREWISFRRDPQKSSGEEYSDIARRVIVDRAWPKNLDIWGTQIIGWTAKNEEIAIRGAITAAAARINIHLHQQAYFNTDAIVSDGDEPYTDDL